MECMEYLVSKTPFDGAGKLRAANFETCDAVVVSRQLKLQVK